MCKTLSEVGVKNSSLIRSLLILPHIKKYSKYTQNGKNERRRKKGDSSKWGHETVKERESDTHTENIIIKFVKKKSDIFQKNAVYSPSIQ